MSDNRQPPERASGRGADGRFTRGNSIALLHGGRRRALAVQDARSSELFQQWATDLGGEESLSAGQLAILTRVVEADQIAATAARYLATTRSKLTNDRVQMAIKTHFAALDRIFRGAAVLGIQRKTKRIDVATAFTEDAR
jgi:hypothetical protein